MLKRYDINKLVSGDDNSYAQREDFVDEKNDGIFHVGQSYQKEVAKTLYCKHCGGNDFKVGVGDYFTAIKCVKCLWEVCVHDG